MSDIRRAPGPPRSITRAGGAQHRTDIDGLRAIAVIAIILFHAGFQWCRGGYRGVDVFFVISGFLITGILLREQAAGTLTLAKFYERRARRILPALFAMLVVVGAAAYAMLLPADLKLFAQNLAAIVLFSSNILFWKRAGGFDFYFEASAHMNPLLHTWSLGVEEQFYLIFPLLVLIGWRFFRRALFPIVFATAVASFLLSCYMHSPWSHVQAEANFYLLPTRAWQLMLGALVALSAERSRPSTRPVPWWQQAAALAGLATVVYSLLVPGIYSLEFPAAYAVPATLGTVLVLAFGRGTVASALLSIPPLVGVGLVSYSAYLWHQPLFAFARYMSLDTELTATLRVALCIAAIAIAWVSWRFVEAPFRNAQRVPTRTLWRCSLVGTVCLLAIGVTAATRPQLPTRGRLLEPAALVSSLSTTALPAAMRDCAYTRPGLAPGDIGCALSADVAVTPTFLVIGDSHAGALRPAFRQLSERTGQPGRLVAVRGCPPLLDVYSVVSGECQTMVSAALAFAERAHIARVFLVARWSGYTDGDYSGHIDYFISQRSWEGSQSRVSAREAIVDGLRRTVEAYARIGVRVDVVQQVPQQEHRPLGVYLQALWRPDPVAFLKSASISAAQHASLQAFMVGVLAPYAASGEAHVIDLAGALCDRDACMVGSRRESYYWDVSHLSEAGALRVSDELWRQSWGRVP